jgi:hypothetical protein
MMKGENRRGHALSRGTLALLEPGFPLFLAAVAVIFIFQAPALAPPVDPRREAVPVAAPPRLLVAPPAGTLAERKFDANHQVVRAGPHLFVSLPAIPPGPVSVRVGLRKAPARLQAGERYRVFWAPGTWGFRADGYAWLSGTAADLSSPPFDADPGATAPYELRLRIDLPASAEHADLARIQLLRPLGVLTEAAPGGEPAFARESKPGAELAFQVTPWGSGRLHAWVGFVMQAPPSRAVPFEVVATVGKEGDADTQSTVIRVADASRRFDYTRAWTPIDLDLARWLGEAITVRLVARPLRPEDVPPFLRVYFRGPVVF